MGSAGATSQSATVRLDDTGIRSSHVNACNVASTREEVVLNFVLKHTWERGQSDAQVQVTNRLILSPHITTRLAMQLGAVVQRL